MSRIYAPSAHALADGAAAFRAGRPFHANPHELGTSVSRHWSRGWREEEAAFGAAAPTRPADPRAPP